MHDDPMEEYRYQHNSCALCGIHHLQAERRDLTGLQLAHIYQGPLRKNVPANVLMLCMRDHVHQHEGSMRGKDGELLPRIDRGVLLLAKMRLGEFDPYALEQAGIYDQFFHVDQLKDAVIPLAYLTEWEIRQNDNRIGRLRSKRA